MKRNAIMLEQTKDTITVPAAFMIRLLACIHSLRNRERILNPEGSNNPNNQTENIDNDNMRIATNESESSNSNADAGEASETYNDE